LDYCDCGRRRVSKHTNSEVIEKVGRSRGRKEFSGWGEMERRIEAKSEEAEKKEEERRLTKRQNSTRQKDNSQPNEIRSRSTCESVASAFDGAKAAEDSVAALHPGLVTSLWIMSKIRMGEIIWCWSSIKVLV
jgi:hypothetical protein